MSTKLLSLPLTIILFKVTGENEILHSKRLPDKNVVLLPVEKVMTNWGSIVLCSLIQVSRR